MSAPRQEDPIRVTCSGTGSPPLPVLTRVSHVFTGQDPADVWLVLRRELAAGTVVPGDLVLLRVGAGTAEEWTELAAD